MDSVDISRSPVDVEVRPRVTPGCWAFFPARDQPSLWTESGRLIHRVFHRNRRSPAHSISWKTWIDLSIYGGTLFRELGFGRLLLHSECHLSTDNRDLSTNALSGQDVLGELNPLNMGAFFNLSGRIACRQMESIHKDWLRCPQHWQRVAQIYVDERTQSGDLLADIPDHQRPASVAVVICLDAI